jgi:hypothetical protein
VKEVFKKKITHNATKKKTKQLSKITKMDVPGAKVNVFIREKKFRFCLLTGVHGRQRRTDVPRCENQRKEREVGEQR